MVITPKTKKTNTSQKQTNTAQQKTQTAKAAEEQNTNTKATTQADKSNNANHDRKQVKTFFETAHVYIFCCVLLVVVLFVLFVFKKRR